MMGSSTSFVTVPFDADMVAILIVVATALDADNDVSRAAVLVTAVSADPDPFTISKI